MTTERVCAVYIIRNINSGKVYIGSSRNYYSRKAAHETALRHDHHVSREMQKDFNRGDRFEFEILEVFSETATNEEVSAREREFVIKYDSVKNGYNTATPGGMVLLEGMANSEKKTQYNNII